MKCSDNVFSFLTVAAAIVVACLLLPSSRIWGAAPTYQLTLVEDLNPGTGNGLSATGLKPFAVFNNQLYFSATDGLTGSELYKYNGEHISLAADIVSGTGDSSPVDFIVYQNKLFFGARGPS